MDKYNEIDKEDSDYRLFFNNLEQNGDVDGDGDDDDVDEDEEELDKDPQYICFCENLKQDANKESYTAEIPISSDISLLLRYEGKEEESFENVNRRKKIISNLTRKKAKVPEYLGGFSGKAGVHTPKTVKKSIKIRDEGIKKRSRDVHGQEREGRDDENEVEEGAKVDPVSCKSSEESSKMMYGVVKDESWVHFPVSLDKSDTNSEPGYEKGHTSTHHKVDGSCSDVEVFTMDNLTLHEGDYTPFVPSKCYQSLPCEEFGDGFRSSSQSHFREKLMDLLKMPYNREEFDNLWRAVTKRTPVQGVKDLRHGRMKSYPTKTNGKSYLDWHKELRMKVDEFQHDRPKVLYLLRGFFFWLKNIVHEGAFQPWLDSLYLKALTDQ